MRAKFLVAFLFLFNHFLAAQQTLLMSGPMVGYSEMKEVMLWVQTKQAARVKIAYWPEDSIKNKNFTSEISTVAENAFTAKLRADKVMPGKKYHYQVYINNKLLSFNYPLRFQTQTLFQHRFSAPDFEFATGSCAFVNDSSFDWPGKPFGGGYEIYTAMFSKKPDFMLWLGDNCYLREADWNSQTGIFYRYSKTRSLPELQPFLASVHHYAILDDHDYGPNDSDRSFWNKNLTTNAFNTFWCNPNTNLTGKGGITGTFQWNDVQFFLMDNRWFRSPNNRNDIPKEYLGKEQVEWLKDALVYSRASFKFICIGGPVLNTVATKENYVNYAQERDSLLKFIERAKIPGVIFLSGDRHFTEITKMPRTGTYPLYDITVSPLLSRVYSGDELNTWREPGTRVNEKNFGIFKITGKTEERKLLITIFNAKGEPLWSREIFSKELK